MTARREKGNKGWLARVFHDPWRKLFALAMAVGLWFFLDSQVTDTEALTVRLDLVNVNEALQNVPDVPTLDVQVPLANYTLIRFEDSTEPGQHVHAAELHFKGAKHLMRRLKEEAPSFYVPPPQAKLQGKSPTFEIDVTKIMCKKPDFEGLLTDMKPSLITVSLAQKRTSKPILPTVERIDFIGFTPDSDLDKRLKLDEIRFEPVGDIRLSGSYEMVEKAEALQKLFVIDLSSFANLKEGEIKVALQLAESTAKDGVQMTPHLMTAIIPVSPLFKTFTLKKVPVMVNTQLIGKPDAAFVAEPDHVDVVIRAIRDLEAELSNAEQANALENWAKTHVLVLATPRDADALEVLAPALLFIDRGYVQNSDYKVDPIAPITVKPAK